MEEVLEAGFRAEISRCPIGCVESRALLNSMCFSGACNVRLKAQMDEPANRTKSFASDLQTALKSHADEFAGNAAFYAQDLCALSLAIYRRGVA